MRIFARTCGVIQGLDFLFRFVFPMWIVAAEMRISLKRDIQRVWFGSSGRLSIFDLTFLVKHDQSMPLRHYLGSSRDDRLAADLVVYLNNNWKVVRATKRLC